MYKRQRNGNHQLVLPEVLIEDIIRENHSPMYVAHPGVHRTYDLIALSYWWPGMRSIENVRNCDLCQGRNSTRKQITPLGEIEMPTFPFEINSMDITGPYPLTPRRISSYTHGPFHPIWGSRPPRNVRAITRHTLARVMVLVPN